jgi:hypothetical protein
MFHRAIANIPASMLLIFFGFAIAWSVQDPNWVIIKGVVAGPFLTLAVTPFIAAIHLVAAVAGFIAARFGAPGRPAAILAAAAMGFLIGRTDGSEFGDPLTMRIAFVAAVTVPWLSPRPWFWAARFDR